MPSKTGSCQSCHSTFSRYLSFMEWHDFFCQNMNGHVLTLDFFGQFEESTIASILIFFSISQNWYLLLSHKSISMCITGGTKNAHSFIAMCRVPSPNSQNLLTPLHKKSPSFITMYSVHPKILRIFRWHCIRDQNR